MVLEDKAVLVVEVVLQVVEQVMPMVDLDEMLSVMNVDCADIYAHNVSVWLSMLLVIRRAGHLQLVTPALALSMVMSTSMAMTVSNSS
jgi:hypothetical protein